MGKVTRLSTGVILAVSLMGCADDGWLGDDEVGDDDVKPFNGVYVLCRGHGQQWATWHPGWGQWMIMSGDPLETCIGPPNVKGADEAPFTIDEWEYSTSSFPVYHDKIAKLCEAKCWNKNQNIPDGMGGWIENEHGVCSASGWPTHTTKEGWKPVNWYNCAVDALPDVGTIGDPYAETIKWGGGSSPLSLPLSCSLLDDCYTQFDGDIGKWTQAWEYGGELGPIVPMERGADYYAVASVATSLTLDMDGGSGPGHDDAEQLDGYAEYSASDCGESTCPFYLASFSAWNDTGAWTISVALPGVFSEEKHIENVQIDALHSSLGAWRPDTEQVAFLPGSLIFAISFDVSSDCTDCTGLGDDDYKLVLRNHEVVFGRFSAGGFALEQTFPVIGGEATLEVDLDVEEGPRTHRSLWALERSAPTSAVTCLARLTAIPRIPTTTSRARCGSSMALPYPTERFSNQAPTTWPSESSTLVGRGTSRTSRNWRSSMATRASESHGVVQLCAVLLLGCGQPSENLPPVQAEGEFLSYAANEDVCEGTIEYGELWMTSVAPRMGISPEEILPTNYYRLDIEDVLARCGAGGCVRAVDGEIRIFSPLILDKHEMVHAIHRSAWPRRRPLLSEGLALVFADDLVDSFAIDGLGIDIDMEIEKDHADSKSAIAGSWIVYWIIQRHGIDAFREFWLADTKDGSAEEFRALFEQHFGESLDAMLADVAGQPACTQMTCVEDSVEWHGDVWTIESPTGCNDGLTIGTEDSDLIRTVLMQVPQTGIYTVTISESEHGPQGAEILPCAGPCTTPVAHGGYRAGTTVDAAWEAGLYRVTTFKMDATDPGVRVEIRPK